MEEKKKAFVLFREAIRTIKSLTVNDINEVKAMKHPKEVTKVAIKAIMLILG